MALPSRKIVNLRFLIVALAAAVSLTAQPKYDVYAIRYGTLKQFRVAGLVAGADPSRRMDIALLFWLIKGEGRNVLVDCGFYRDQFMKQWNPADYEKPSVAIERAGIKAEDVTDIIVTHIHWDHADGFDLFPKAKIWIQKDEIEYYAGEAWNGKTRTAADPDDILGLVKLNTQGRVALVNGDAQDVLPGITCYIGGKHTFQSQYVVVKAAAGTVVLASDNVYLYENMEKHVPIAATLDPVSNLRAQDRMKQLASNPKLIVPGHDPAVMKNFREVAPGVVKIE